MLIGRIGPHKSGVRKLLQGAVAREECPNPIAGRDHLLGELARMAGIDRRCRRELREDLGLMDALFINDGPSKCGNRAVFGIDQANQGSGRRLIEGKSQHQQ